MSTYRAEIYMKNGDLLTLNFEKSQEIINIIIISAQQIDYIVSIEQKYNNVYKEMDIKPYSTILSHAKRGLLK